MFSKLREKTGKQFVKKYQYPFGPLYQDQNTPRVSQVTGQMIGNFDLSLPDPTILPQQTTELFSYGSEDGAFGKTTVSATGAGVSSYNTATGQTTEMSHVDITPQENSEVSADKNNTGLDKVSRGFGAAGQIVQTLVPQTAEEVSGVNEMIKRVKAGEFDAKSAIGGIVSASVSGAAQIADDMFMSDKNFGAQSEAIDSAVHGVSGALMKSGNPYAMAAGAALEGANFLTKAGGQTVQGFDVDINSSGYGQMGHMESSSSRDFGAMIGLGGIFGQKSLQRKLQKRNEQALMAMNAANIAEDQSFEQEARANSIQNTIMNNQIALSGGLDTSLLGG